MKRLLVFGSVLALTACGTTGNQTLAKQEHIPTVPDFEVHAMPRSEVIASSEQCVDAGMKPFVEYITQKTPYGRVMVPVNVHCNPIRKELKVVEQ